MRTRNVIWNIVKVSLFGLLLFLLTKNIPFAEIPSALHLFTMPSVVCLVFLLTLRYILLALRWQYSSRVHSVNLPIAWFIRSEFEILFLEFVLPLPDAEDVFKILYLKSKNVSVTVSMSMILLMRVCGMGVTFVLLLGLIIKWGKVLSDSFLSNTALVVFLIVVVLPGIAFHKYFLKKAIPLISRLPKVGNRIQSMMKQIVETPIKPIQYMIVVFYSVLFFVCFALSLYLLVQTSSYSLKFINILLLVPLFTLSVLLPLSIQGLGLAESTIVLVLPLLGVPKAVAAAVATLHLTVFLLLILFGGILVWLSSGNKLKEMKLQLNEWKLLQ